MSRFVSKSLFAALSLALMGLSGCAGFEPQPGPPPEPGGRYLALTTPFVAVGDTQEHESTGYPLHDNDSAIDAFVEVLSARPSSRCSGGAFWNGRWSMIRTNPSFISVT